MVPSGLVEAASIVVLGGNDTERAQLVAQLATCGLPARSETQLQLSDGLPALLVVIGSDVSHLVAEARDVPALAEVPILALVPSIPPTSVAEALNAGATDVARLPVPQSILAARCRNLTKLARRDSAGGLALTRINDVLTAHGDDAEALVQVLEITANVLGSTALPWSHTSRAATTRS